MSFKAILVPLSGSDTQCDTSSLRSALIFSKRLGGHIDALHVLRDPRAAAAFVGEGMTTSMIESVIDLAEKDSKKRSAAARKTFQKICDEENIPIEQNDADANAETTMARFVEKMGNQEDFLPEYGRMFDLIVVCKNATDEHTDNDLIINSAILETGRPVLVLDAPLPDNFASKIAVIWNGSIESSRAITHALPILKAASEVSLICAIDDFSEDINPDDAIRYLAVHGITAKSCIIRGSSGRSTAEALLNAAKKSDADFLVMGAYTKSRLRRLFFGAVTGEMLEKCSLPILMVH